MRQSNFLKHNAASLKLLGAISIGCLLGLIFKEKSVVFKPFGDIFLNLLFTIVVPLVFFSISSAVASMNNIQRLGKIILWMMVVFIVSGVIASVLMLIAVQIYPPAQGINISLPGDIHFEPLNVSDQIVKAFTVSDFFGLLSKKNMLALIIFASLIGLSACSVGEKSKAFTVFLLSGNAVMMKAISYIMLYAPVGLGAYFAYLIGVLGPQLLGTYVRAMTIYYPIAIAYFFIGFSFYVFLASGKKGLKVFWPNIMPAALTALATSSSMATIPVNLEAAERIGVPQDIREMVIPIGSTIHMDGSCLSAVLKTAVLFGLFHMNFSSPWAMVTAVGVALLSGTVMSGIPAGGFLGELMIVTLYGFPIIAMPIISMIGTLVDPPATMVNAIGDNVSSMLVARILGGKNWMSNYEQPSRP
ncbi:MAG: dicarboxylate/amino acid:cation symporter [Candidatus Omnitrophica bacterium]|nr:dicarboxylate/amino acid:cation symporter [Candidatus Omnitrophota bacterium]